jgi:hypothetical protein
MDIGVREEDPLNGLPCPTFAIPMKNRRIRVVTDFRKLILLLI